MKRYNKSKNKMYLSILTLLILFLGIGYSVLTEQLSIHNTINYNSMNWEIKFSKVVDNGGTIQTTGEIINEGQTVKIQCNLGKKTTSETCIAKATISNNSTFNVNLSKTPTITYDDTYIESIEIKWDNHSIFGNDTISSNDYIHKNSTEDVFIKITTKELDITTLPTTSTNIPIALTLDWQECDEKVEYPIELISGDGTNIGDEVKIRNEHFYVISNDGTNATLFAKYNLEVGNTCEVNINEGSWNCEKINNPSRIQNSKAIGVSIDYDTMITSSDYGAIEFSSYSFWVDGNENLLEVYGNKYPAYVYNETTNAKTHVDYYENYLKTLGVPIISSRLIKQEELIQLGCNNETNLCKETAPSWVYSTTYWTGSAYSKTEVQIVRNYGNMDKIAPYFDDEAGIRPVITIPSSLLTN